MPYIKCSIKALRMLTSKSRKRPNRRASLWTVVKLTARRSKSTYHIPFRRHRLSQRPSHDTIVIVSETANGNESVIVIVTANETENAKETGNEIVVAEAALAVAEEVEINRRPDVEVARHLDVNVHRIVERAEEPVVVHRAPDDVHDRP